MKRSDFCSLIHVNVGKITKKTGLNQGLRDETLQHRQVGCLQKRNYKKKEYHNQGVSIYLFSYQ